MHAGVPREAVISLAGDRLVVDDVGEAVQLVVVEVGGGGEVEDFEELVLGGEFQS